MDNSIRQAVILAGGYGTRLRPYTDENPKPMYPVEGKPFLEHLLLQVKSFGIQDIVLLLGYLPEKVQTYFGNGEAWGMRIRYAVTPVECDTGERLLAAEDLLEKDFLLMYCDNYCPIDFRKLVHLYQSMGASIGFVSYVNRDQYTRSNLRLAKDGKVLVYDKSRKTPNLQGVDIGYALVDKSVLSLLKEGMGESRNFEAVVYPRLVEQGKLYAMPVEHRYYSIGSWERMELTKKFFSPRKFIFLDRDGTLNVRPPKACYIQSPEAFRWLPGAKEAVKLLKDAGYQILLFTNQPGVAKGVLSMETLDAIHARMQKDLKEMGAGIDGIYCCTHDWGEGCFCRKPKPGLLFMAQKEHSINLARCYVIGDDERDMEAGQAAGCRTIMVSDAYPLLSAVKDLLGKEE